MKMRITPVLAISVMMTLFTGRSGPLLAGNMIGKTGGADSQVVLFSQPFCPGCEAAKRYFQGHHISYLEFDITTSRVARDTFERLGGRGTPFFLIGGERLHGFSVPRIERRLSALGISGRSHQ